MSETTSNRADLVLTQAVSSLAIAAEKLGTLDHTPRKASRPAAPRRGLSRQEAADYVGISASGFTKMMQDGIMPEPVRMGGRTVWDIYALDAAFDLLAAPAEDNPWDQ